MAQVTAALVKQLREKNDETEKPNMPQSMTARRPKRPANQPVMGVTTAVARMLKVIVQEISSSVAAMAPCICGRMAEAMTTVEV